MKICEINDISAAIIHKPVTEVMLADAWTSPHILEGSCSSLTCVIGDIIVVLSPAWAISDIHTDVPIDPEDYRSGEIFGWEINAFSESRLEAMSRFSVFSANPTFTPITDIVGPAFASSIMKIEWSLHVGGQTGLISNLRVVFRSPASSSQLVFFPGTEGALLFNVE